MKIVADKNIPFLEGVFEPYGVEMVYLEGKEISRQDVMDADGLIIRTRTRCDAELLEGTAVKVIATATIGTDHIDFDYCNAHHIEICNAQGCNAGGVMQYVFSALYGVAARKGLKLDDTTMGIIGVGNVGRKVEHLAEYLGFKVLKNDPPRAAAEHRDDFCSLEYLLAHSDVITMHTPLNETTKGMADRDFFAQIRPGTIFINASRGEVVVDEALKKALPKLGAVIIDTWNNEPHVDEELISMVDIATPHIAGYSLQGKQNGTALAVRAIAKFFGIHELENFEPEVPVVDREPVKLHLEGKNQGEIASIFQYNYPIFTDDFMFRLEPDNFEKMRSEYNYRREVMID